MESLRTYWYTDRGRRPTNEDAVVVERLSGDRDLVAVADGMGGHVGGEVASAKALQALLASLESDDDLTQAIRAANAALIEAATENPEWRGMGTTLVAVLRAGSEYWVANVGDSRAYRIDENGTRRITEDHSFTAEAVSSGRLSQDEAERSPWRNALTRAVGTDAKVEPDVFGPFPLDPPHLVLLCTDGLYRVMDDEELVEELLARRERPDGARELVASALRRGSSDNISVAVVEFGDVSSVSIPVEAAQAAAPRSDAAPRTAQEGRHQSETAGPAVASDPGLTSAAGQRERAAPPGEDGPPDAPSDATDGPGVRAAPPARVQPRKRRSRAPRRLPSWVKREGIPTLVLIVLTLLAVYVVSSVLG